MAGSLPLNKDFKTKFYKDVMPKIYGIGASVVIAGAMFKLLNWPGGTLMLGLGLTTEAIIFFLSSFEPHEKEVDWTKVYPELLEEYPGDTAPHARSRATGSITEKLDDVFAQANIDQGLIERLGQGMHRISDSVENIASIADVSLATEKYKANLEKASEVLGNMYEAHAAALGSIHSLTAISQDTQNYHEQLQAVTESLYELNSVYKKELQYEFYTHAAESMERLQAASDETEKFKTELAQLSQKIASLNNIYGNMLTALKN